MPSLFAYGKNGFSHVMAHMMFIHVVFSIKNLQMKNISNIAATVVKS